jgi:hypothetical protein
MIHQNKSITTSIIPSRVQYLTIPGDAKLDFEAICCFAATGFFLNDETFFVSKKALKPATTYQFDNGGNVISEQKFFSWQYNPRDISFKQALSEFTDLFENIVNGQTSGQSVILPISGGLDSRTLAVALKKSKQVFSYSYQFKGGVHENRIGRAVAKECGFPFESYEIEPGYLWNDIERIAQLNGCYADFINPRQVAVVKLLKDRGNLFLLGHWGDVLFDSMGVSSKLSSDQLVEVVKKKLIKQGGQHLASALWKAWGLKGSFDEYFHAKISSLLAQIPIDDANAKIRAFKSMHWAPRWTSTNLVFFQDIHPIAVPYYHDEMCRWICTVPEQYLAGRQLQIEYIKLRSEAVASVPWQSYYPCNLYNYKEFDSFKFVPYRAWNKGLRFVLSKLAHREVVTRNWEIQFLGKLNDNHLKEYIFDKQFNKFIPAFIAREVYDKFQKENLQNAHPLSMLLTLALFNKVHFKGVL